MLFRPHKIMKLVTAVAFFIALTVRSAEFLPHGWTAHSSNGQTYYYNQNTGLSQWERPIPSQPVKSHSGSLGGGNPSSDTWNNQNTYGQSRSGVNQYTVPLANHRTYSDANSGRSRTSPVVETPIVKVQRPHSFPKSGNNERRDALHSGTKVGVNHVTNGLQSEGTKGTLKTGEVEGASLRAEPLIAGVLTNPSINPQKIPAAVKDNSHIVRLEAELQETVQQIAELREMIVDLEVQKLDLLEKTVTAEKASADFTTDCGSAAALRQELHLQRTAALESKLGLLQLELDGRRDELEALTVTISSIRDDVEKAKSSAAVGQSILVELISNCTLQAEDIKVSRMRIAEHEKELSDAYKEIKQLTEDMRNVAEPSLRRLRQPSVFSRVLETAFPVWSVKGVSKGKKGRKTAPPSTSSSSGTLSSASVHTNYLSVLNRTIDGLRENLTAMAAAVEGKELVIEELSLQVAERIEEAEKRRFAYAALKEGVEGAQECNEKLEEDIALKEEEIADLNIRLAATIAAGNVISDELALSEISLMTCEDSCLAHMAECSLEVAAAEGVLCAALVECKAKEENVSHLLSSLAAAERAEQVIKTQLANMAGQLEESLALEQAQCEARASAKAILKAHRRRKPWFLFFWPF